MLLFHKIVELCDPVFEVFALGFRQFFDYRLVVFHRIDHFPFLADIDLIVKMRSRRFSGISRSCDLLTDSNFLAGFDIDFAQMQVFEDVRRAFRFDLYAVAVVARFPVCSRYRAVDCRIDRRSDADSEKSRTFAVPFFGDSLRYGVMVALQILALSVRVRVLLSQQFTLVIKGLRNYARFLRTLPDYQPQDPEGKGGISRPAGPGICRKANTERRKGRGGV